MIIDTNVYSALDKGRHSAISALGNNDTLHIPIVVVAELRYGFAFGSREDFNNERLSKFLAQDRVVLLALNVQTADIYAELASLCRKSGRALSNNDIWIAALAKQHNVRLATYDKDFNAFADILDDKLILLND